MNLKHLLVRKWQIRRDFKALDAFPTLICRGSYIKIWSTILLEEGLVEKPNKYFWIMSGALCQWTFQNNMPLSPSSIYISWYKLLYSDATYTILVHSSCITAQCTLHSASTAHLVQFLYYPYKNVVRSGRGQSVQCSAYLSVGTSILDPGL